MQLFFFFPPPPPPQLRKRRHTRDYLLLFLILVLLFLPTLLLLVRLAQTLPATLQYPIETRPMRAEKYVLDNITSKNLQGPTCAKICFGQAARRFSTTILYFFHGRAGTEFFAETIFGGEARSWFAPRAQGSFPCLHDSPFTGVRCTE